ncbi:DUF2304 domain-containing protein [Candidatus Woesebacteria bacterium]|nr:DUF2304 domain-containing protein [Candidatus Woesebacteria bacterium]MCD8506866.1 DUF2304 domain-containing protein [Candidatus Woesebacteria bacterium]MCD8527515.1 DUF2304 domain-containing protein [Candidatus Woesebacteria bacterium]MCD8546255.1 DUF2304 domain-containing protein [Candidatus Woesebacteria bacterium]
MILFQVAMAFFAVGMLYVLRIHYRKQHLGSLEFGSWVAVWSGFILLALMPSLLQGVADALHIGRVFDLLVIIAFVIVTSITLSTRLHVLRLEEKVSRLIRLHAIQAAEWERERVHIREDRQKTRKQS